MKHNLWKERAGKILSFGLLILLGALLSSTNTLERWDRFLYDYLTKFLNRPSADNILIIAIDEQSLAEYGRWPWPRRLHADLIDKLSLGGAKAIGFDIIISEPNPQAPEEDQLLAEAVARSGVVFMPVLGEPDPLTNGLQLTAPIPPVKEAVAGLGHVHFEVDSDGIMRRTYLMGGLGKPDYPALTAEMLNVQNPGFLSNLPGLRNSNTEGASAKNWVRDNEILIPFAGPPGHFLRIGYSEFMQDDFDPTIVAGRYVLVGTTAAGLGDSMPTPVSGESVPMPGVEINANLLDALIHNLTVTPMDHNLRVLLTILLLLVVLLIYPLATQRMIQILVGLSLILVLLTSGYLLSRYQLWYPPGASLFAIILSYPLWAWRRLEILVQRLFKEKEQALVTLHSIGDGVITTDTNGLVRYMNPIAETLTGFTTGEALGKKVKKILPLTNEDHGADLTTIVQDCLLEKRILHLDEDALFVDRYGKEHAARISAGPLKDQQGNAQGTVLGVSDVTEKRYALRQLSYRSTHDIVTGLPNRILCIDRLGHAIARAQKIEKPFAVHYINLDSFKKANDTVGHDGGNELLRFVSKRLEACCKEADTLARLGADEFVLLQEELTDEKKAAFRADKIIRKLQPPFVVNGQELFLSCGIGISIFPKDGFTAESLMTNSNVAMYEAKKKGPGTYVYFSAEMNEIIQQRLQLEAKLRTGLAANEFELYFQPQVRLRDNRIVGAEALIRWNPEKETFIPPSSFIPMAEESGLILPLTEWILRTACKQAKLWQDTLPEPICVSINISPRHFQEDILPTQLKEIIEETGVDPKYLDLEITESSIMEDVERSAQILGDFKKLGGTVSIDDFGTGYSSLAYLRQFPFDKLKIDKAFIDKIDKDAKDEGLAKAIIGMGHGLGFSIVAEGVDTFEQLAVLKAQQCDIIQGYYFHKPLPAEQLTQLLMTPSIATAAN